MLQWKFGVSVYVIPVPVPSIDMIQQELRPGIPMHLGRSLDTTIFRKVSWVHGAQPGFSANKTKNTWWTVDSPQKNLPKNPKFQPSIQGACEGITQTVCDGNLRGSSVRYRVAGFSKKNPWRQPSPQIILKARNPVWSGGRVEKTQVTSANTHVRMHPCGPCTHECACMHGTYVRADGPT